MEIDSLVLRLVWGVVEGERAMVPLELRVRLLVGVIRGVSLFETTVVEVDLVLVVVSVLLAGSSSWW